jgi:hypothetical protein
METPRERDFTKVLNYFPQKTTKGERNWFVNCYPIKTEED